MTTNFKVVTAGQTLELNSDGRVFDKTQDQDRLDAVTVIQGMTDAEREAIMQDFGFLTLADFDDALREDEEWILRDRLDYYTYDDKTVQFTAKDGAWFSPEAVESVCGASGGNVAANAIDGLDATFWRHATDHEHSVVFRLRDYPKKITKIRFRYNSTEPANERLNNLAVHASRRLQNIDQTKNILETGIEIVWPTGQGTTWVEHTLAKGKARARYIKLVCDSTDQAQNTIQIREFEVWVEVRKPGEN